MKNDRFNKSSTKNVVQLAIFPRLWLQAAIKVSGESGKFVLAIASFF